MVHTCGETILQALRISARSLSLVGAFQYANDRDVLCADPAVKLEALESVVAPKLRSGGFKATDKLNASLRSGSFVRRETIEMIGERALKKWLRIKWTPH